MESPSSGITLKVVLMGELGRWAGTHDLVVELPEGSTFEKLGEKLSLVLGPAFAKRALTKEGAFQPHVALFLDGVQIGRLEGNRIPLSGRVAELMLLPSYEGG